MKLSRLIILIIIIVCIKISQVDSLEKISGIVKVPTLRSLSACKVYDYYVKKKNVQTHKRLELAVNNLKAALNNPEDEIILDKANISPNCPSFMSKALDELSYPFINELNVYLLNDEQIYEKESSNIINFVSNKESIVKKINILVTGSKENTMINSEGKLFIPFLSPLNWGRFIEKIVPVYIKFIEEIIKSSKDCKDFAWESYQIDAIELSRVLKLLVNVEKLKLIIYKLRESWPTFIDELNNFGNLTSLMLISSSIYGSNLPLLLDILHNKPIIYLDISGNEIGADGASYLATFLLKPECKLISLNISNNKIGGCGMIEMFQALQINKRLKFFSYEDNEMHAINLTKDYDKWIADELEYQMQYVDDAEINRIERLRSSVNDKAQIMKKVKEEFLKIFDNNTTLQNISVRVMPASFTKEEEVASLFHEFSNSICKTIKPPSLALCVTFHTWECFVIDIMKKYKAWGKIIDLLDEEYSKIGFRVIASPVSAWSLTRKLKYNYGKDFTPAHLLIYYDNYT